MGASRKLQGEIDRVLKKVQEGVDVFDSIWNKVYDTDNANQKEKFEADLKKEIKKLQRYRDQIKTWIQSSDIKDKKVSASYEQALMDARKLIEREMERFKICEKETKTKAFSKEGLGQQPKTDPKEKAKSETRDWLNNVVSELESQIDSFEAELEGLTVKKGKTRPARLTHLETSIVRHKAHIMKLELILRLLDNDELSPEQVNDVKDLLDDYVERNQDNFDEFDDVDDLYNSLPLEKVEALEDLVTIGPPGLVKGVGSTSMSLKTSLAASSSQIMVTATPAVLQGSVTEKQSLEIDTEDNADVKTPSQKNSVVGSSGPSTPVGGNTASVLSHGMQTLSGASTLTSALPGSVSGRDVMEHTTGIASSTLSVNLSASTKEENLGSFTGQRPSSVLTGGIIKGTDRGSLSSQPSVAVPQGSNSSIPSNGNMTPTDMAKRNILSTDERIGNSSIMQPLLSPMSNRMILSQATKLNEGTVPVDSSSGSEAAVMSGRVFPPSVVAGTQWRSGSPFQTQNEVGQFRGRTELPPDQKENFLQRLQQIQQQGHSNLIGMPPLAGGNHKPFSVQQQNPSLQQFASQTSSVSSQVSVGNGVQGPSPSTVASNTMQLQLNPVYQPSQQTLMSIGTKETDVGVAKAEEQQQGVIDEVVKSVHGSGKDLINEDDSRSLYMMDTPVGTSSLSEPIQLARDADLSRQPLQSNPHSGSLGVIGRKSVSDLGAIGDNLGGSTVNSGVHDQLYNLQMLEAMFYKLPHPKDSERPRHYVPKHPVATPACYPQVQAPVVNNPAFWERLGVETLGTDTLFFAFYYQQNTYQQYLAAKELKKQSWRYHRKYNTWFQRHEEPKVATDEFEQGAYVYFDFHIADDNLQHGWCQRIKTEFTFEYNHLEDEL